LNDALTELIFLLLKIKQLITIDISKTVKNPKRKSIFLMLFEVET